MKIKITRAVLIALKIIALCARAVDCFFTPSGGKADPAAKKVTTAGAQDNNERQDIGI